jgi:hypothetical protein
MNEEFRMKNEELRVPDGILFFIRNSKFFIQSLVVLLIACAPAAPTNVPNGPRVSLLTADHQWLETLRKHRFFLLQLRAASSRSRLGWRTHAEGEPVYVAFMDMLKALLRSNARSARGEVAGDGEGGARGTNT